MKILYLEASSGSVVGGSLTGMLHLIAGLDRTRFEPVVVLFEEKPVASELRADGIRVHTTHRRKVAKQHSLQGSRGFEAVKRAPAAGGLGWNLRQLFTLLFETLPSAFRLAAIIRSERPDVVHACNGLRGNMDAVIACRLAGVPCVVHAKGFDKFTFVERWAAPYVAHIVSMTQAIEDHCRSAGIKAPRMSVSFDGLVMSELEPRRSTEEIRGELGLPGDALLVGVVGHIQPWKGQHVLVEAVGLLSDRYERLYAAIVGGVHRAGEEYAAQIRETAAKQGIEDRVIFTGERDDAPDLMRAMDVVVHSSVRPEPFGRVIIEALAVGAALVASKAGGVLELVEDGTSGLLSTPGDAADLARNLDRILGDPDFANRLRKGARERAERFTVDKHVAEIVSIYEAVVPGNSQTEAR